MRESKFTEIIQCLIHTERLRVDGYKLEEFTILSTFAFDAISASLSYPTESGIQILEIVNMDINIREANSRWTQHLKNALYFSQDMNEMHSTCRKCQISCSVVS